MEEIDKTRIISAIEKTGFLLENEISILLEKEHYSVIRNRYYVDATTNSPREIDILAYKAFLVENIKVCFCLLISCKKSLSNDWVYLTKSINTADPNFNFYPQTIYYNYDVFDSLGIRKEIQKLESNESDESISRLFSFNRNVYAFQEISSTNKSPQNDKAIFSSIDSLLKSSHYEIKSCMNNKDNFTFYHFHLVNIFDGNMFELNTDNDNRDVTENSYIKYINRFIVGNTDSFYRFFFTTKDYFPKFLSDINHYFFLENQLICEKMNDYKSNFLTKYLFLSNIKEHIEKDCLKFINHVLSNYSSKVRAPIEALYPCEDKSKQILLLEIDTDQEGIDILNKSNLVKALLTRSLKKWCRYESVFTFCCIDQESFMRL